MQTRKTGLFIVVAFALTASANSAPMSSMHQAAGEQFERVRLELKENFPSGAWNIPVPAAPVQILAEGSRTDALVRKFKTALGELSSIKSDIRNLKWDLDRVKRSAERILRDKKKDPFFSSRIRRAASDMQGMERDLSDLLRDLRSLEREAVPSTELNRTARDMQYAVRDIDSRFRFDIEYTVRRIESTVRSIVSADSSLITVWDKTRARQLDRDTVDAGRTINDMEWPVRRLVSNTQ